MRKLSFFYKLFQRCADVTVVTNDELAQVVSDNGGIPFVMPDRLPRTVIKDGKALQGTFNIVCICTFGTDEPFEQLVHAARAFPEGVIFHFTGDDARVVDTDIYRGRPRNVLFTGFISDDAYWQLLGAADLVVDLTKRQSCLVCGAYEAVAAGVPMLLSDTRALREYFYKGAVFSGNSAPELVENITYAMRTKNRLKEEVADLKKEIDRAWPKLAAEFLTVLDR